MKRYVRIGFVAAVVVAALVILPAARAAERPRSALDEIERREMRRPEGRPAVRHEGPPPEPVVLRFVHIPAESFMETLEQLGRNEHVREALRQMPMALNEPANAVVLLAPPEVAGLMRRIAEELDQPNEFEMQGREREREELQFHIEIEQERREMDREEMAARLKLEAAKRHLAGPPMPMPHGRPPQPRQREERERQERQEHEQRMRQEREKHERPMQREREERERREHMQPRSRGGGGERPGSHAPMPDGPGAGLEALLGPRAREELGLSEDQAARIRDIVAEIRKGMERVMGRVREALKDVPLGERGEQMRRLMERVRGEQAEQMRAVRERIFRILRPEQREKVERWLGRPHPVPPHGPERPPTPERREPPRRPERPHHPASQEAPAEFRLIQNVIVEGAAVRIEAAPGGGVHGGGPGGRSGGWGQMDEAGRRAMMDRARNTYLFRMLADEDIRAELNLGRDQEVKIAALIEKAEKEREHIRDDVRLQFGSNDAAGPAGGGDPEAYERDMRRETWQAMRDAQPVFDEIMKEAVDTLTEEQKVKLQEVVRERARLMQACGNLWILTTAGAKEKLDLSRIQSERIKKILLEAAGRLDEQRSAFRTSIQDMPEEGRREAARAMYEGLRKRREESIKETRERVFAVLTDEQKQGAEKLLEEADAKQRSMFSGGAMFGNVGVGGQSRAPAPGPARGASVSPAVGDGTARLYLAAEDLGRPTSKSPAGTSLDAKRGAALLRLLDDPAVRAQLNLSREQDKRIFILQEKVTRIQDRVREKVREMLADRPTRGLTDDERRDLKRQVTEVQKEAMRAAQQELAAIMKDAAEVLTPDQQAKLREVERDRAMLFRATGGLAILLAPQVRERVGITDRQADRIEAILKETADAAERLRREAAGGGEPETLKRRHAELVRDARRRIMAVLAPDQREAAERYLDRAGGPGMGPKKRGPSEAPPATKGYGQAA